MTPSPPRDARPSPRIAAHVPHRRCVACRRVAPKTALHRLVAQDGVLTVDPAGTRPGRGAYVCDAACHAEAVRRRAYGRALRRRVTVPDRVGPTGAVTAGGEPPAHLS